MSEEKPLRSDLSELLNSERARPAAPDAMRARVHLRVASSLAAGVAIGGSLDGAHRVSRWLRWFKQPWPLAISAFVAGGVVGAELHAVSDRSAEHAPHETGATASQNVAAPSTPASAIAPSTTPPPVDVNSLPRASGAPKEPLPHRHHDDDLAAERLLLDTAQSALARSNSAAAIETLERDEQDFPEGQLVEEREALMVQALVQAGRDTDARVRGEQFRRKFPQSILLPAVDAALKSIP